MKYLVESSDIPAIPGSTDPFIVSAPSVSPYAVYNGALVVSTINTAVALKADKSYVDAQIDAVNTDLSAYVLTTTLNTTLSAYVTNSSLSTTLTSYATTTALSSGLAGKQNSLGFTPENVANKVNTLTNSPTDYPCTQLITSTLTNYVTGSALTATLTNYVTNAALSSALSSYVLTTTLANYVTNSSLTTTLGSYVTSASLTTTLGGYATISALTSGLATKQNLLTNPVTGQSSSVVNQVAVFADTTGKSITPSTASLSILKLLSGVLTAATQSDLLTLLGTLPIANGGTNATTAIQALINLLPTQISGKFLTTNGTTPSWSYPLPIGAWGYSIGPISVTTTPVDVSGGVSQLVSDSNISLNTAANLSFNLLTVGTYEIIMETSYTMSGGLVGGAQGQINPLVLVSGTGTLVTAGLRPICGASSTLLPVAPTGVASCTATITVTAAPCVVKPQLGQLSGGTGSFTNVRYKIVRLA